MFNLTAREKLTKARVLLIRDHPFFARLVLELKFEETDKIPTAGVNKDGKMMFNPKWIDTLTEEQIKFTICHEVLHPALLYFDRIGKRNHQIFNIAHDLCINDILIENNMKPPEGIYIPQHHSCNVNLPNGKKITINNINNRSAEDIYQEIFNVWEKEDSNGNGDGDWEKGFDEIPSGDSDGDEDIDGRDKDYWKNKVAEAGVESRNAGKSPRGMERLIDGILNPKMSWRQLLSKYIRSTIPFDFTWRRPSKKSFSTGVYLPNTKKDGIKIVFLIDTSGSMSNDDLKTCFSEINGIVKSIHGVSLQVIYHDTQVYEGSILNNPNERDILNELKQIKGGGGTDFVIPYEYIETKVRDFDVVVHLTDCYGQFPKAFRKPLIICIQRQGKDIDDVKKECPYALVVKVRE